jgi:CRISPR/Cas system endoribonuclease Cas6 (RAMP superfamily)
MRIELINDILDFTKKNPNKSIKDACKSLGKDYTTLRDYYKFLVKNNEIDEDRKTIPFTYSIKKQETHEASDELIDDLRKMSIKMSDSIPKYAHEIRMQQLKAKHEIKLKEMELEIEKVKADKKKPTS